MKKKDRCKLCGKPIGTKNYLTNKYADTVRVKTDLFGKDFDEIFHEKCWKKLKIY